MFSFLFNKANIWFAKKQANTSEKNKNDENNENDALSSALEDTLQKIQKQTNNSADVIIREMKIGGRHSVKGALVFIDGMVKAEIVNEDIMKPLMFRTDIDDAAQKNKNNILKYIYSSIISVNEVELVDTISAALSGVLNGDVVLLIDGSAKALVINSKGWEKRGITEPANEAVVRGPRETFIENLRTNTSMLRRKIKNPAFTIESMIIGEKTKTNISIVYINGVAKPALINEVKKRIKKIDTDAILESGYIEQFIEDSPGSIFATIGYTEKPDVAAAKLLEGRVAVVVDGTPFVLTMPYLFIESLQAAEDYYFRPYFATMTRLVRAIGFATTVLAPAFYVAVSTYHQELIPTSLLITMARAREGIPFPAFIESIIMIVTFEILREAGIRLPRPVGQALSIVGALVIGEAAVSAGLIGAPMVIVVAITAVSGFVVPNQNDAAVIIRIFLLILGANFGGFGMSIGILILVVHLSSLESFGFSYLSPIIPFDLEDSKDTLIRAPLWMMISRPKGMASDQQRSHLPFQRRTGK